MYQQRRLSLVLSFIVCFLLHVQGADEFTDGNRPYEFGFKVDGQQHRHEKKDKDGIIMGEFGFITADDVYHVTVYATDKEGRFKILSMKNIHLKALPPGSTQSARQGHSLTLPEAPAAAPKAPPPPVSQAQNPFESVSLEPPGRSCSSCSIPTTTPRAPPPAPPIYNQANNNYNSPEQHNSPQQGIAPTYQQVVTGGNGGLGGLPNYSDQNSIPQKPISQQTYPQQFGGQQNYPGQEAGFSAPTQGVNAPNPYAYSGQNYPGEGSGSHPNYPEPNRSSQNYPNANNFGSSQPESSGYNGYAPQSGGVTETHPEQDGQQYPSPPYLESNSRTPSGSPRSPKQYNGPEQQFSPSVGSSYPQSGPDEQIAAPVKPTLLSAQMQIVDKNTDIHKLRSGEKEGLPAGLTKHDMVRLLYTFNYTLGFQGHFEEGYSDGVKKGYYFVTGRNGIRMRIDYVADDTGFHPKVSQDVLDVLSEEVPKPETEKDEKYGLKGYEFKWLYYPVDSKRR